MASRMKTKRPEGQKLKEARGEALQGLSKVTLTL